MALDPLEMIQLILHLVGDYVTQSDWMATRKTKASFPAAAHALVYSIPFALIASFPAWVVILVSHFFIDRFRLARYVVYAKNLLFAPWPNEDDMRMFRWSNCCETGYPSERPAWLAVWLLIAADNTIHLVINYAAILWL